LRASLGVWVLAALLGAAPAGAGNEINQACALVGCVPGDAPGFPVTLVGDGSYLLTGNLQVTDPNLSGIILSGPIQGGIRIDLNGFEVAGPVVCSGVGSAMSCTPGAGTGILATVSYVAVVGGTVRGFGAGGVRLVGGAGRIERVTAHANGGFGISVAGWSIVSQSIARLNGGIGIRSSGASVIERCIAADNQSQGIFVDSPGVVVTRSTAFINGHDGIGTQAGAVVQESTAYLNERAGIAVGAGSIVTDNSSFDNTLMGIYAEQAAGALISRNTLRGNGGCGLIANATTTYRENNLTVNGCAVLGGVPEDNACDGASCP
jgi:hypothetical protein